MSQPAELSFDEILKFMIEHNGKVTNHELVKYFKVFLTNPDMRDEARSTFKKHVNTLAIIKNHNNEKWLILKKKYMHNSGKEIIDTSSDKVPSSPTVPVLDDSSLAGTNDETPPERPPLPLQLNQDLSILNSIIQANKPHHLEPINNVVTENIGCSNQPIEDIVPKVSQRRKSSTDKLPYNEKMSMSPGLQKTARMSTASEDGVPFNETLSTSKSETMLVDSEQTISVKERKQMFNRMASEGDILKPQGAASFNNSGTQEEDRASVNFDQKAESDPLDSKQKGWILSAARGDYYALAKMCGENAKLAKTKDPFTTALHWACKRGNENLVKLLAGASRNSINERSGYTPLHIAMQFRHENIFRLLVDVYDADPNILDWSGKKPRQYLIPMDTSLSPGSYRTEECYTNKDSVTSLPVMRSHSNAHAYHNMSKKEGFLRIGSLNVRVKKTTEAFSNFLGVGATRSSTYGPKSARNDAERRVSEDLDQLHKNWGSADNIPKDDKLMLPPMSSKVRRRGASGRKGLSAHSRSTPSTPDQPRASIGSHEEGESDSDNAAGFHAAWRQQRASNAL